MKTSVCVAMLALALGIAGLSAVQRTEVPRVVVLGIDGMGADNVWRDTYEGVPPPEIPNIGGLVKSGAYSLTAGIDPLNFSGPNWMGMLAGSYSSEHGVDSNDCTRGAGLPTIFEVLHDAFEQHTLAVIHEWDRIACYYEPTSVGLRIATRDEQDTAQAVIDTLADGRVIFIFAHLDRLDGAGHDDGGNSTAYTERMEAIDRQVGRILRAVSTSPRAASTFVILTADHGHRPEGGGHASSEEPVPFIVTGPGVVPGEIAAAVHNNQVAPLVAHIFGIAPSPEWSARLSPFDAVVPTARRDE
jgi:hypothetical protein